MPIRTTKSKLLILPLVASAFTVLTLQSASACPNEIHPCTVLQPEDKQDILDRSNPANAKFVPLVKHAVDSLPTAMNLLGNHTAKDKRSFGAALRCYLKEEETACVNTRNALNSFANAAVPTSATLHSKKAAAAVIAWDLLQAANNEGITTTNFSASQRASFFQTIKDWADATHAGHDVDPQDGVQSNHHASTASTMIFIALAMKDTPEIVDIDPSAPGDQSFYPLQKPATPWVTRTEANILSEVAEQLHLAFKYDYVDGAMESRGASRGRVSEESFLYVNYGIANNAAVALEMLYKHQIGLAASANSLQDWLGNFDMLGVSHLSGLEHIDATPDETFAIGDQNSTNLPDNKLSTVYYLGIDLLRQKAIGNGTEANPENPDIMNIVKYGQSRMDTWTDGSDGADLSGPSGGFWGDVLQAWDPNFGTIKYNKKVADSAFDVNDSKHAPVAHLYQSSNNSQSPGNCHKWYSNGLSEGGDFFGRVKDGMMFSKIFRGESTCHRGKDGGSGQILTVESSNSSLYTPGSGDGDKGLVLREAGYINGNYNTHSGSSSYKKALTVCRTYGAPSYGIIQCSGNANPNSYQPVYNDTKVDTLLTGVQFNTIRGFDKSVSNQTYSDFATYSVFEPGHVYDVSRIGNGSSNNQYVRKSFSSDHPMVTTNIGDADFKILNVKFYNSEGDDIVVNDPTSDQEAVAADFYLHAVRDSGDDVVTTATMFHSMVNGAVQPVSVTKISPTVEGGEGFKIVWPGNKVEYALFKHHDQAGPLTVSYDDGAHSLSTDGEALIVIFTNGTLTDLFADEATVVTIDEENKLQVNDINDPLTVQISEGGDLTASRSNVLSPGTPESLPTFAIANPGTGFGHGPSNAAVRFLGQAVSNWSITGDMILVGAPVVGSGSVASIDIVDPHNTKISGQVIDLGIALNNPTPGQVLTIQALERDSETTLTPFGIQKTVVTDGNYTMNIPFPMKWEDLDGNDEPIEVLFKVTTGNEITTTPDYQYVSVWPSRIRLMIPPSVTAGQTENIVLVNNASSNPSQDYYYIFISTEEVPLELAEILSDPTTGDFIANISPDLTKTILYAEGNFPANGTATIPVIPPTTSLGITYYVNFVVLHDGNTPTTYGATIYPNEFIETGMHPASSIVVK